MRAAWQSRFPAIACVLDEIPLRALLSQAGALRCEHAFEA
jgi:hypothetical protein